MLTLEWIDGTPLSDRAALVGQGLRPAERSARAVIQTFLRHALRDGFFHADMHPGNLFVDDSGRLVAVDFGIMGRLGAEGTALPRRNPATASSPATIAAPRRCISRPAMCRAHHSVESFAQAIRAIGEPIHNRTAEDISMAKLLTLLFEVTGLFDMRTRPELLLLQKTMVVVEGVARSLDPKLDMWTTAEPVVREWIERHLGPAGSIEDAAEGAGEIGRFLGDVPGAARTRRRACSTSSTRRPATASCWRRRRSRRSAGRGAAQPRTALALWVIAALLASWSGRWSRCIDCNAMIACNQARRPWPA